MKRRILCRILVFALVLSMLPAGAFADSTVYTDTENHWAKAAIEKWSGLGIIQGADGTFRPDDSITRGETAVILDRVMKYETKSANNFSDLGQDFYTDAMLKANAAGIIKGDAGAIRPQDKITREEAVVVLGRALGLAESTTGTVFSDSSSVSSWASGYVNAMVSRGYIQGADGFFNPKAAITRAEFVTILNNAISKIFQEETTYSENIVGTVIVNVPGAVLKNMTVEGDLILSEGVGDGDVTLENVTVTGNTIVRGGGANSIHITGNSNIASIIVQKTDDGKIRIVTADGAEVDALYVDDGSDDIILTGDFKSVTIAEDVSVKAVGATIQSVRMTGAAAFDVDSKSTVDALTADDTAEGASITVAGKVGTLTADAKIAIDNDGTITKAVVNANGVTIDGTKPSTVTVASSVTKQPTDSDGNAVGSSSGSSGGSSGGGGGSSTPTLSVTVRRLEDVCADDNEEVSAANQAAVSVDRSGDTVTVSGNLAALNNFTSTVSAQGTHRWVGLVVKTGQSSIIGVSYNGTALTAADVTDAESVGVDAGSFVLWIKADEVVSTSKTFTLSKSGYKSKTITVKFVDTNALTGTVTALAAENVPEDTNETVCAENQGAIKVTKAGDAYTVTGNLGELNTFASTVEAQGSHKWVGLVVATGQESILGVSFNGTPFTSADVADAESVGAAAGSFVLWLKEDALVSTGASFTLSQDGRADKTVTIKFADTTPLTGTVTALAAENVPEDTNKTVCAENQGAIKVTKAGDAYTVTGNLGELNSFTSTNTEQDDKPYKWIGLVVATGQDDITKVKYGGTLMTAADVADADSVKAPKGSFVLWLKVDAVVSTGASFTLSQDGRADKTVTINFVDTNALTGTVTKLGTAPADGNATLSQFNQDSVEVTQDGNTVTVSGYLAALKSFTSTDSNQTGEHKWVGLVVATGQSDITTVKYNGQLMTDADVADAESVNAPAGSFVLWIKAEEVVEAAKGFTLSQDGRADKTITVKFTDTPATAAAADRAVTGTKDTAIANTDIAITLEHDSFEAIAADTDLSAWFTNLPEGLTAKAKTSVPADSTAVTVTISGTPTAVATAAMAITIPGTALTSGVALDVTVDNEKTYFSIVDSQVAAVTNIKYEVVNGDVQLVFTRPADETGISQYEVEFSTDNGLNWGHTFTVNAGSNHIVPMSILALSLTENTAFNKVRVTSVAAAGYTDNVAMDTDSFAFTVDAPALTFTVTRNDFNKYTVNLPGDAVADELYSIEVTKSGGPSYYPLGFVDSCSTIGDDKVIAIEGDEGKQIEDGSVFTLRKISVVTESGMTVTKKQDTPVSAS